MHKELSSPNTHSYVDLCLSFNIGKTANQKPEIGSFTFFHGDFYLALLFGRQVVYPRIN